METESSDDVLPAAEKKGSVNRCKLEKFTTSHSEVLTHLEVLLSFFMQDYIGYTAAALWEGSGHLVGECVSSTFWREDSDAFPFDSTPTLDMAPKGIMKLPIKIAMFFMLFNRTCGRLIVYMLTTNELTTAKPFSK